MEGPTIDRVARAFAARDSRRGWLRAAAGFAVAAAAGRAVAAPAAAHKAAHMGAPGATCSGNGDCAPCHGCDAGACHQMPNGTACSGGLGACKKGHCRIAAPKLLVTSAPPCTTVSVSGLEPETPFSIALTSPCYGGARIEGPRALADGTASLGTECGNCVTACPETSSTSITVTASGTSAKSGKPFKATKRLKHIACVPLSAE